MTANNSQGAAGQCGMPEGHSRRDPGSDEQERVGGGAALSADRVDVKERPILFSGPMVRALLAGTKTQTRRAIRPQPHEDYGALECGLYHPTVIDRHGDEQPGAEIFGAWTRDGEQGWRCPYGQPGERLWVRESWMDLRGTGVEARDPHTRRLTRYAFAADTPPGSYGDQCRKDYGLKWRPSIHMPRSVCRIELEVTAVRVERLWAISEADSQAEGWDGTVLGYAKLWESINGAGSWDANPWVWVVEFKRAEPDSIERAKRTPASNASDGQERISVEKGSGEP